MKKRVLLLLLFGFIQAGLFDFHTIDVIQKSYKQKNYANTIRYLYDLKREDAVVNYDLGNAYYKAKEYKNALKYYKRALGEGVEEHNRLHNIGNCYFYLKEYKNAIIAYKKALQLRKDPQTKANLELAQYRLKHKELDKVLKPKKRKLPRKMKQHKTPIKNKKLTKKELEELKKKLKEQKMKKELKKLIKKSFKNKEVPILMYKIQ